MNGADHAFILARRRKVSKIQDGGCAQSWETASAGRASSRVKFHARPPARHRSSFCVLILLASLVLRLLRPAVCRLLKQHRQLFHLLQRRQFYRQHVRAHITPARNTRPSPSKDICHPPGRPGPPKTQPNNSRHPPLYFFFSPFPKIKPGVSCSGCTSCILRSLSSGPLPAKPRTVKE